ncbi:MAG: sodium:solute symporter family protein [Bacteroidota bacterium]
MLAAIHPLDLGILIIFLAITLIVGLSHGRQVKTIQDYALGGKNFSTATLVATIIATWYGGGSFFNTLEQTYSTGLYFTIALTGISIGLLLQGWLVLRMKMFINNVSVAEAVGSIYGKIPQVITAVGGALATLGYVSIQFKVISRILVTLFDFESSFATIVAAGITILYSASGGIKAVTFTDVFQFFTFGTILPVLALVIWHHRENSGHLVDALASNPLLDLKQIVDWRNPQFLSSLGLLLYFIIPGFSPDLFQRMAMARNVEQGKNAFVYAALISLLISLLFSWIGFLLLADNPGLEASQVVVHMVNKYTYPGLKGLVGIGVTALAMSTADSCLNTASAMFANDIVRPLRGQKLSSTKVARSFTILGGAFALLLSLYSNDLLSLMLLSSSFYKPVVAVPVLMAVLGFRTSTRVVLLSMASGALTVVLWRSLSIGANSVVPGMLVNLFVLLVVHYLLGEPGGWKKVTLVK